jgi:small-conductance mechanosensitive channel
MEFEELQKIWDTQNNAPLYVINEKALHNRIIAKKSQASHIANTSEWILIIVNTAVGIYILTTSSARRDHNVFIYALSAWMFLTALYAIVSRVIRLRRQPRYDRSMIGDLQHALGTAAYQVRLSHAMRLSIIPLVLLMLLSFWQKGTSIWMGVGVVFFYALVYYASSWEHNRYKARKKELEVLYEKMLNAEC